MKKLLISLLILLLFILNFIGIAKGIQILGLDILGVGQIKDKNDDLDAKIGQATTIASTDYPKVLSEMEVNLKKLEEEKKNYEDMVTISTDDQVQLANQYQKYEVEYLWTIIGNHATKEGVVIKIDIVAASGENNYNLNFTVTGSYIGITEFISDIENDSALGFKIENFSMKPGSSADDLRATFTCKDIVIKDINKSVVSSNGTDNGAKKIEKDTTETNNTNTDETTKNTNTTNSTTGSTTKTEDEKTTEEQINLDNNQ